MAEYPGALPGYDALKIIDNNAARGEIKGGTTNPWLAEIVAICTELGIDVAGSASNLVTRLAISLTAAGKLKLFQICTHAARPDPPTLWMIIVESDTGDWFQCTKVSDPLTWKQLVRLEDVQTLLALKADISSQKLILPIPYSNYAGGFSGNVFFKYVLSINQNLSDPVLNLDTGSAVTNWKLWTGAAFQNLTAAGFPSTYEALFYLWSSAVRNTTYYGYWQAYQGAENGDKIPIIISL